MHSRKLSQNSTEKTYVVVFDQGDEVAAGLLQFAREEELTAAHFTAIGALSQVTLGWFDLDRQDYERIPLEEQLEVLSLVGNVALHEGEPQVHAHVVVGRRNGTAMGGHLLKGHVRPTLEVMLTETPRHLHRQIDQTTGLPLIVDERDSAPETPGHPVSG